MKDPRILELIEDEKFVQWVINPNPETNHYWSKWLSANPDWKSPVEWARQIILSTQYKQYHELTEEDYNLVLANIVRYSGQKPKVSRHKIVLYWSSGVAAACLLVFLVFFLINEYNRSLAQPDMLTTQTITKVTQPGQKLTIRLPDGTKVILNSESKLIYSVPFISKRKVRLTGEAFFDVVEDPNKPMFVHAGNIITRVVGTSFNVRSYPDESEATVSVVSGKVEVSDSTGHEASLIPNFQGVFNFKKEQLLVTSFSIQKVVGWKDGMMVFDQTPLPVVFKSLERWYGVEFHITDKSLLDGMYTGQYENASLEKVLEGVSYASGFDYQMKNKKVIINKRK